MEVKVGEEPVIESSPHQPEEIEATRESMLRFLKELDTGGDTWPFMSDRAKASFSKTGWSATLLGFQGIFGKIKDRQHGQAVFTEKLPDAPSGRYFVCEFNSTFTKSEATERLVMVLEEGEWRVAGYFRTKSFFSNDEN